MFSLELEVSFSLLLYPVIVFSPFLHLSLILKDKSVKILYFHIKKLKKKQRESLLGSLKKKISLISVALAFSFLRSSLPHFLPTSLRILNLILIIFSLIFTLYLSHFLSLPFHHTSLLLDSSSNKLASISYKVCREEYKMRDARGRNKASLFGEKKKPAV